ncbi:MAG TPA: aldehyde dehydrogenase family protein [Bacteroidales bacterium]|nr:aldehyde dehydrogenase family protein [Bacteroidales bacterium]
MTDKEIQSAVAQQKEFFMSGRTLAPAFRKKALKTLQAIVHDHMDQIAGALQADLGKSAFESYATETGIVLQEIRLHLRKFNKWSRPKRVGSPLAAFPASSRIVPEPYGCTLIISPWNYPLQLALAPLVGAISAGNCAIIKPSEYSIHTSALLEQLINNAFDPGYIRVINGEAQTAKALLALPHDMIFFTGSPQVGKLVMKAAADHLTPVVLELGGKSPCIVDETTNLSLAARRIVWGKLINAGQTCIAPDYVLVPEHLMNEFDKKCRQEVKRMYGDKVLENPEYPKIINQMHFNRLLAMLEKDGNQEMPLIDSESGKIGPAFVHNPDPESPIMQEEIFGPLLPLVPYKSLSEAIAIVQSKPKPLALYIFSKSRKVQQLLIEKLSAGGVCINDTIMHFTNAGLPFGGVGYSGSGSYHGKYSFDAFTHYKPILCRKNWLDVPLRYPPFANKLNIVKKILR